jgi:hypothetical protein
MRPEALALLIAVVFPLAFAALWAGVLLLLSVTSGWRALAAHYARDGLLAGEEKKRLAVMMGAGPFKASYRGAVTMTAAKDGLGLRLMFPLKFFHSPLLIPWADLQMRPKKVLFGEVGELRARLAPRVAMLVRKPVAEWIAAGLAKD